MKQLFRVGSTELPLLWGEVVPWYFIKEVAAELNIPLPPVIYIGMPPSKKLDHIIKLGVDIVTYAGAEMTGKRISVLVSGDLSHYHSTDPRAPYPYNEHAVIFDALIKEWGQLDLTPKTLEKSKDIMKQADDVSDNAGSCGFNSFLFMHSLMSELIMEYDAKYRAHFYEYAVPTYFGMTITSWVVDPKL